MLRLTFVLLAAIFVLGAGYWFASTSVSLQTAKPQVALRQEQANPELLDTRYVFDISVHTEDELRTMLERADKIADSAPDLTGKLPVVALVLHGPEVEFFANENYAKFKDIVDRAAVLDGRGFIEVKMCRTMMRSRNMNDDDVPPFIEIVPFGPDEIERLRRNGYQVM